MFTIEDIIKSENLEELFIRVTNGKTVTKPAGKDILKSIKNFGPIYTDEIDPFIKDKNLLNELEKYGRHSLVNYIKSKRSPI